jgi:WXG100 family type VII secretion target
MDSLRVDPDTLEQAAGRLSDLHESMRAVLAKAHNAHLSLHGSWSGGAATTGSAMWTGVHDAFAKHLDELADNAVNLLSAAGAYRNRDDRSAATLDEQL